MKKFRIIISILSVLLCISVGLNIKQNSDRNKARRYLLNSVNACFVNISRELDKVISGIENDMTNYNYNRDTLIIISNCFIEADTLLMQYKYSRLSEGLNYGAVPNFNDIAHTIGFGSGTFNDVRYNCILHDDVISENEMRYLVALRDDIVLQLGRIQSTKNPPNENEKLTIAQLNNILNDFFDTWSYHNENSPYFLLRNE